MKLAAIAVFALVGLAVAQSVRPIPIREVHFVGEVPAEWWTYAHVISASDGTPVQTYTVPHDRYFVITRVEQQGSVLVDGASMPAINGVQAFTYNNGTRVVCPPGSVIESHNPGAGSQARLWGYLEPVR